MKTIVNNLANKSIRTAVAVAGTFLMTAAAHAFPTWMGVYGDIQRHTGENPGLFKVLMNESYYGLNAQVGIIVNGEEWVMHDMTYQVDYEGNSVWTYMPDAPFPPGSTVEYFFYGYDHNGGQIWDSNDGQNYFFNIPMPNGPLTFGPESTVPHSTDMFYVEDSDMAAYNGTLYAVWCEAGGVQGIRFSKKPSGGTWSEPMNLNDTGWKCSIAVAESGIHVTYVDNGDTVYERSLDNGQTWSDPLIADFYATEQKLAADSSGVYLAYMDSIDNDYYLRKIPADNPAWGDPSFIFEGTVGYWSTYIRDFRVHGENMALTSYEYFYRMGGNRDHTYRESTDGGATWTATTPEGASYMNIDVGSDGKVYLSYGTEAAPTGNECYFHSRVFGGSWSEGQKLFDSGSLGMAALDDMLVALSRHDGQVIYRVSEDGGGTWSDVAFVPHADYVSKDISDGTYLHLVGGLVAQTGTSGGGASQVTWMGDTFHWPFDGEIDSNDDFWVNTYTYPQGAAAYARVVYSSDNGTTWSTIDMEVGGQNGDDDWWHVNLGTYNAGVTIQYAIEVIDQAANSHWHKDYENGGQDYFGRVNGGANTYWVGNTVMFSQSGAPLVDDEIWLSTEAWPKGGAVAANIWYTADGGANWQPIAMKLVGEIGNNDRFHYDISLLGLPAGTTIQYAIQVIDGFGTSTWDSNEGNDYFITLE